MKRRTYRCPKCNADVMGIGMVEAGHFCPSNKSKWVNWIMVSEVTVVLKPKRRVS
jgi:hypothetical protein